MFYLDYEDGQHFEFNTLDEAVGQLTEDLKKVLSGEYIVRQFTISNGDEVLLSFAPERK